MLVSKGCASVRSSQCIHKTWNTSILAHLPALCGRGVFGEFAGRDSEWHRDPWWTRLLVCRVGVVFWSLDNVGQLPVLTGAICLNLPKQLLIHRIQMVDLARFCATRCCQWLHFCQQEDKHLRARKIPNQDFESHKLYLQIAVLRKIMISFSQIQSTHQDYWVDFPRQRCGKQHFFHCPHVCSNLLAPEVRTQESYRLHSGDWGRDGKWNSINAFAFEETEGLWYFDQSSQSLFECVYCSRVVLQQR